MKKIIGLAAMVLVFGLPQASHAQEMTGTTFVGRVVNYIDIFGLWTNKTQGPIYIDGFSKNPFMDFYKPSLPRTTLPAIPQNPAQFQPSLPRTSMPPIQENPLAVQQNQGRGSTPYTIRNNGYTVVNPR
jgi:hypothetical protein